MATIVGDDNDNTLTGTNSDDLVSGLAGADTLTGGTGDDTYNVDDSVVENAGEGNDTVKTMLGAYTLGANVENLAYLGATNFSGTGNGLDNTITGGARDDTLDGGTGADRLIGGSGNNLYIVGDAGDSIAENTGEGNDTVETALAAYTLAANVDFFFKPGDFAASSVFDVITDFSHALKDKIDLSQVDAIAGGPDNAFAFIGAASFGGVAGQLHYVVHAGGVTVQGDTNGDAVADFSVDVNIVSSLVAGDFIL